MSTYQTPIPGLSGYAGASQLANQAYNNAMARYTQQRSNTLLKYGYSQGADGSIGVDANNQFGGYQQMLKSESGQIRDLGDKQASSGWGGNSGVLAAQRSDLQHAQGAEQTQLGQSLTGALTDISQGEQEAAFNKNSALYQAQETATQNAINQNQFNPANPPDAPTPVDKAAAAVKGGAGKQKLLKAVAKKMAKGRR